MIALPTGDSFESLFSDGIRLGRADDVVLDGLVRRDVAETHRGTHRDAVLRDLLLRDHARREEPLLELGDPVLQHRLLVLGVVVLGILGDIAELAGNANPLRYFAALFGLEIIDLLPELLVALGGEYDFLQSDLLNASNALSLAREAGGHSS